MFNSKLIRNRLNDVVPWLLPIAVLLVWEAASRAGLISGRVLPAPSEVMVVGYRLLLSGELLDNVWISSARAFIGLAVGGSIGFALGLANGISNTSERLTDTLVQMIRNVPHLALIPLVILWFGIEEVAKIFLVALGVFFPIYINTLHGIRTVDPQLVEMGPSTACHRANYSAASSCLAPCPRSSSACATRWVSCG
jgi:sulfonate transport system permease protein